MTHAQVPPGTSDETRNAVAEALAERGWVLDPAPRFPILEWARQQTKHAVFGCKKVKHGIWDDNTQKVVEVGRICSTCGKEYPFE